MYYDLSGWGWDYVAWEGKFFGDEEGVEWCSESESLLERIEFTKWRLFDWKNFW